MSRKRKRSRTRQQRVAIQERGARGVRRATQTAKLRRIGETLARYSGGVFVGGIRKLPTHWGAKQHKNGNVNGRPIFEAQIVIQRRYTGASAKGRWWFE